MTPKGRHRQTSSFFAPRASQPAVLVWRWLVRTLAPDSVLSKRSATFVFRSANLNGMLSIIIAAIMSGVIEGQPYMLTAILSSPDARAVSCASRSLSQHGAKHMHSRHSQSPDTCRQTARLPAVHDALFNSLHARSDPGYP